MYENGNIVIRQRPLIVQTVNNVPNLTSKEAFESDLVKNIDVKTDVDSATLTFAENRGPLWDDCVHITFDATYTDNSAVGETDVDITNAVLDTSYGDARNYYLQKIETPQKGFAVKSVMTAIEITTDPTQNNDGTSREYKYGDKLDFSGGKFKLTYDNGDVIEKLYTQVQIQKLRTELLQQLKITMERPLLLFRQLTQLQKKWLQVR